MGAGTNVQDKLIALHHLDCPWRPSDFEQREGRIIRQGNENPEVYIFRYVTQNTPIATAYQSVQIKAGFINRIMDASSDIPTEAEDISGNVLDYATVKMLTTGNPLLQEQMDLDIKIKKLNILKSGYLSNKYTLEDRILNAPAQISQKEQIIALLDKDVQTAQSHQFAEDEFSITINNTTYTDKKRAGSVLLEILHNLPHRTETDRYPLGVYRGFSLSVGRHNNMPVAYLKGELEHFTDLSEDIYGNLTRLNNRVNSIQNKKESAAKDLDDFREQIEEMKQEVSKPFEQEEELKELTLRYAEVLKMVNGSEDKEVEFKSVSEDELNALTDTGIEIDYVQDRSSQGNFIIKYARTDKQQVEDILNNFNNTLKK